MEDITNDKSYWALGGMTMVGVGVGLMFVQTSPLIMVGFVVIGVGLGLVVEAFLSQKRNTY